MKHGGVNATSEAEEYIHQVIARATPTTRHVSASSTRDAPGATTHRMSVIDFVSDLVKAYATAKPIVKEAYVRNDGLEFLLYGGTGWDDEALAEIDSVSKIVEIAQERLDASYRSILVEGMFSPIPEGWSGPGPDFVRVFAR